MTNVVPRIRLSVVLVASCSAVACSGGDGGGSGRPDGSGGVPPGAGGSNAGGSAAGAPPAGGGSVGQPDAGPGSGGVVGTGGALPGAGGAGVGGSGGAPPNGDAGVPPGSITLQAMGANTTVGLEWPVVAGATGYHLYWSTSPGVTAGTGQRIDVPAPDYVHRGLTNGTTYYYVVTAETGHGEGPASAEASATPGGEWALERLGTGRFRDVVTGGTVAPVPIERRVHVFLFAEGYTATDLPVFHDEAAHAGARNDDVDAWVDLVFGIEPYSLFPEAFVVWYLPRVSNAHIGGDTAFVVPVDLSASFPAMASVSQNGETAARAWDALGAAPYPPSVFYGNGRVRNAVASFLLFDPARGRASVSGLTTTLANPADGNQRVGAAFGVGHAHEFTHAFSLLRDEYIETSNSAPTRWDGTSNVVGTNQCAELPWAHLLAGGAVNPSTQSLVGAFGEAAVGYHPELLCLLNGTHDNAQHYGGNGTLRVEDRMCNFCREVTAFRVFERTSVLADEDTAFDTWVGSYRGPFYEQYGFHVPDVVPQTNDVRNPAQGAPFYEACAP